MTVAERTLRADARRNREEILKAAKAVFAKHGTDAQMDDIARRAKLGVGTLYRHFPTKDALRQALVLDRIETIIAYVRDGLEHPDAFEGLCESMWRGAEMAARDRGLSMMFSAGDFVAAHDLQAELAQTAAELVRRAQDQGTLRADFRQEDIPFLMCGITTATNQMGHDADAWKRALRLIFDGMRARPENTALAG